MFKCEYSIHVEALSLLFAMLFRYQEPFLLKVLAFMDFMYAFKRGFYVFSLFWILCMSVVMLDTD